MNVLSSLLILVENIFQKVVGMVVSRNGKRGKNGIHKVKSVSQDSKMKRQKQTPNVAAL